MGQMSDVVIPEKLRSGVALDSVVHESSCAARMGARRVRPAKVDLCLYMFLR